MAEQEPIKISAIARIYYDRISKGIVKSDGTVWSIDDIPASAEDMRKQVQYLIDNSGSVS